MTNTIIVVVMAAAVIAFVLVLLYAVHDNKHPNTKIGGYTKLPKNKYIINYLDGNGNKRQMTYSSYNYFFDQYEAKNKLPKGSKILDVNGSDNNKEGMF